MAEKGRKKTKIKVFCKARQILSLLFYIWIIFGTFFFFHGVSFVDFSVGRRPARCLMAELVSS